MKLIYNGGPAFPVPNMFDGMSLRDYFAAKAMLGLLMTIGDFPNEEWRIEASMDAYAIADAMLRVRKNDPQQ